MAVAERRASPYQEIVHRLVEARLRSDELFAFVKPDSLYERPIPERHRIIFYLGHLEAFDWNLLRERMLGAKPVYPEFDRLFAFGIDPVSGGLPCDQPEDWPAEQAVREYVKRVRQDIDCILPAALSSAWGEGEFSPALLLNVAIEHRLMHAETLAYMLHQLCLTRKIAPPQTASPKASPIMKRMIEIPAGAATLGLRRDSGEFGWDNEYEAHTVSVPAFAVDRYKVSNADYLQFIDAGGYQEPAFWTDADWNWKNQQNISHPAFWKRVDSQWFYRTMFDEIPLPQDWPVYVSHAEASAYARWAGKALPTEAQWHWAALGAGDGQEGEYPWGSQTPDQARGNFDFHRWDPVPVNAFPNGESAFGVADLLGNGWEWTSTVFGPFPGFERFPFYPGYSADFFDGKHYVMKGGSARTAACMLRRSFRNWFQTHYQYVYAGFRCVSN